MGILVNDGDSKPVNLAAYAVTFTKVESVKKHGSHDQKTHGAWSNGNMSSLQETNMNAATDTLVNAYRDDNTGRVGVQASLGQAIKHHNMAVESVKSGDISGASKHSLEAMKSFMSAAADAQGIDRTVLESSAQKYSEYMVRALDAKTVEKHGSHDQSSHGAWANGKYNPDDAEGEDEIEPKNYRTPQKLSDLKDDSEGEFEDSNYDDPRHMDDMDILRPFGGNAFANSWRKSTPVTKHGGGSHNQESHGSWAGNGAGGIDSGTQTMLDRGKKALEGKDLKAMLRDYDKMEAKWRKKLDSKPYDPENEEYGDPQDLAQTEFQQKYGASVMDVEMYGGAL